MPDGEGPDVDAGRAGEPERLRTLRFPFAFNPRFGRVGRLFGVRPDNTGVEVTGDQLVARFGSWQIRTPTANVRSASVTGPYAWPKVLGPPRLSLSDRGLTFATNADEGVCIDFVEPVDGVIPFGVVRHPNLTVTVEDGAGLATLLNGPADT